MPATQQPTTPGTSTRRRRTSNARRPILALDVARAAEAAEAAAAIVPAGLIREPLDFHAAVAAVVDGLKGRCAPEDETTADQALRTNRAAVVGALVSWLHDAVTADLVAAEADLAERLGLPTSSFRSDAGQRAAVTAMGLDPDDTIAVRAARGRTAMKMLERIRKLITAEATVRTKARDLLCVAYEQASADGDLPAVVRTVTMRGGDGEALSDACVRFEAGRHYGLVKHQANRLAEAYPGYTPEDMFGWGWRGVVTALRNYDPTSFAFSTYACTRIVGHIQDGVRAESWIPKRLATWSRKVTAAEESLSHNLGRPPTGEEVAEQLALDRLTSELGRRPTLAELADRVEDEIRQMQMLPRLGVPASFDELADGDDDHSPRGWADDGPDPAAEAMRAAQRDDIAQALAALPPEEAEAVLLLDYRGLPLNDARQIAGVNARQLRARRMRGRARLEAQLEHWRETVTA